MPKVLDNRAPMVYDLLIAQERPERWKEEMKIKPDTRVWEVALWRNYDGQHEGTTYWETKAEALAQADSFANDYTADVSNIETGEVVR